MAKIKGMRFKVNTVACDKCNKEFNVRAYKNNMPMPKRLPSSHIEHECGGDK